VVTALLTWLVAVGPVVRFTGDVACPTIAEVDSQSRTLLPAASESGERDVATLEQTRSRVRVTLRRPDGTTLGEREFDRAHSCAELAGAIALVIATWESDVHPEFALTLPPPAPRASPSPVSTGGQTAPPLTIARRPESAETAAKLPIAPPALRAPPGRSTFDVGAALVAAAAPHTLDGSFQSDLVVAGSIVAGWLHHGRGPGARLALGAAADRLVSLGPGEAHWRRATAAFGPQLRVSPLATVLDLHAELIVAALNVRGQGFLANANDWSLDLGAGAGVRLWIGAGTWRPWLDLSVAVWPREHVIYVSPSAEAVSLPKFEALLALGVAFCRS
jgi:hypothetical protein